jgi:hypothetical protein
MTIVERTSVAVFGLLLAWIFQPLQSGPTTKAKPAHLPRLPGDVAFRRRRCGWDEGLHYPSWM